MKVRYKEDPRAWRKSTLLTTLGLALVASLLFWRHVLTLTVWASVIVLLGCVSLLACACPRWFRAYYRFSTWAGFWSSQLVARVVLACMFIVIIVPAALIMRLLGKDPLSLKRPATAQSYWGAAGKIGPLDRLF